MKRLSLLVTFALLASLPIGLPVGAAIRQAPDVGAPITSPIERVSEHGYRFGGPQYLPDISGNTIVWQDERGTSQAYPNPNRPQGVIGWIWSKNLTTRDEAPLTTFSTPLATPMVSGKWVAWTDAPVIGGVQTSDDIYACQLPCTTRIQVTTEPHDQDLLGIDGTTVLYMDNRSGNWDLYTKKLPTGAETPVVVAPGNQGLASISGGTVAWRDDRDGGQDVWVKSGATTMKVATVPVTIGPDADSRVYSVAVSGKRLLWNEPSPACGTNATCTEVPRVLKTCTLPCTTIQTVDSLPVEPDYVTSITDLDLSGAHAAWVRNAGRGQHVYTRDLATRDHATRVDTLPDLPYGSGGFNFGGTPIGQAVSARVDGDRYAWTQASLGDQRGDIYWRDTSTPALPRRASSISLGGFGSNVNPSADTAQGIVTYRAAGEPGPSAWLNTSEQSGPPVAPADASTDERSLFQVWTTSLSGEGRDYSKVSTMLSSDASRPAIGTGGRIVWSECFPDPGTCTGSAFERTGAGPITDMYKTGPADANGTTTAWQCGNGICVNDNGSLSFHPVDVHYVSPGSTVGSVVRISGRYVAWQEIGTDGKARLHRLDLDTNADVTIGSPDPDGIARDEFEISGPAVVFATANHQQIDYDNGHGVFTLATPTGDGGTVTSPSIGDDRAAWLDCNEQGWDCSLYTRARGESQQHLVTNATSPQTPFVDRDGDHLYWASEGDIYMTSASGISPTPFPIDATAPGNPTDIAATAVSTGISLKWTNPGASDFFRVRILRKSGPTPPNGIDDRTAAVVYDGSIPSFLDTDVAPGVQYSYRLFAYDFEPNYSSGATVTVP